MELAIVIFQGIFKCMKWSIEAWKDFSATAISNCWNKVDIIGKTIPVAAEVDTVEEELNELIRTLRYKYLTFLVTKSPTFPIICFK
jgi:hypothetical protein